MTTAQVTVLDRLPTPACLENATSCVPDEGLRRGWIDVASLRATLQGSGVRVETLESSLRLTFPGRRETVLPTSMNLISRAAATSPAGTRTTVTSDRYISSRTLLFGLAAGSGLPVRLQGWINPKVSVGSLHFTLGTAATPFDACEIYINVLLNSLERQGPSLPGVSVHWARSISSGFTLEEQHRLQVNDQLGTVYGLLTRDPSGGLYLDAAPVDSSGQVKLTTLWKDVTFVRNAAQLVPPMQPLGIQKHAMLVRFTGWLDSGTPGVEVIVPESVRSIAGPRN